MTSTQIAFAAKHPFTMSKIAEPNIDDLKAQWEENLQFYCKKASGDIIKNVWDFTIICNSRHLIVTVSPGLPEDPITSLLVEYHAAIAGNDDQKIDEIQDEIVDLIHDAGWQKFISIAPPIPKGDSEEVVTRSVFTELNPETFHFNLVMSEGNAEIVERHPPQWMEPLHLELQESDPDLPRYKSRDLPVVEKISGGVGYIAKVQVNELEMCCKVGTRQAMGAVQREYDCLRQIARSKFAASLPAPKLLGLVVDDNGILIGILEEFIVNRWKLSEVLKKKAVFEERRRKWGNQIRDAIVQLHEIDVI